MSNKNSKHALLLACLLNLGAPLAAASERPSGGADDVVVNAFLRDQIRSVIDQVRAYRGALTALTGDRRFAVAAKAAEAKIEALLRRAEKLTADTRLEEAAGAADEANRLIVETIARMRSGDTVVVSLSFDSPAAEFAYERRRFESSEVMLAMTLEDGRRIGESQRKNIDALLAEAHRQSGLGEQEAAAGKYADAVRTLEGANRQMTRALQALGVPVF